MALKHTLLQQSFAGDAFDSYADSPIVLGLSGMIFHLCKECSYGSSEFNCPIFKKAVERFLDIGVSICV